VYNGDLQSTAQAAIVQPTQIILLWGDNYNHYIIGREWANPVLSCGDASAPCYYNPNSTDNGYQDGLYTTAVFLPGQPKVPAQMSMYMMAERTAPSL
jgi:hypothetical protein